MPLYKVYHDGSHFVGIKQDLEVKRRVIPRKRAPETLLHRQCFELYKVAVSLGYKSKRKIIAFMRDQLYEYGEAVLTVFVPAFVDNEFKKLYERIKRFRRKAFLNPWNYFITITYDSALLDEEAFAKKLPECLSHLHSRRGWNYMGVWERGEKGGRLHFHALAYVPPGEMIGALYPEEYFDKKTHSRRTAWRNTFFDLRFGRTDFTALSASDVRRGTVLNYLLKYLQKSGERIIYSRGVPTDVTVRIPEKDVVLEYIDYVEKAIIADDCLVLSDDVIHAPYMLSDLWWDGITS